MEIEAIMATTHLDSQHQRIPLQTLEGMARQAAGSESIPFTFEHDRTLPPLGKTLRAEVRPMGDGEYGLYSVAATLSERREVQLPDGAAGIEEFCPADQRPLAGTEVAGSEKSRLDVDPFNFETRDDAAQFLRQVSGVCELETGWNGRKSAIPDPEAIITASASIAGFLLARKMLNPMLAEAAQDIKRLYCASREAVVGLVRYAVPKNRPITCVVRIPGHPCVELALRTKNAAAAESAFREGVIEDCVSRAIKITETLPVVRVQFLCEDGEHWHFNFALTDTGSAVGTPEAFARRSRRIELQAATTRRLKELQAQADDSPVPPTSPLARKSRRTP